MLRSSGFTVLLVAMSGAAFAAQPEFETEQVNLDTASLLALGGSSQQRLAQAFKVDVGGYLSHLTLPMSCQPKARIHITIEKTSGGVPNGSVLAYEVVPGHVFSSVPTPAVGFRIVEFGSPVKLGPGQYAFTLTAKDGDCGVYAGPVGDSYPGGKGYFEALPNPPGWIELFDAAGTRDLAFQVFMRH